MQRRWVRIARTHRHPFPRHPSRMDTPVVIQHPAARSAPGGPVRRLLRLLAPGRVAVVVLAAALMPLALSPAAALAAPNPSPTPAAGGSTAPGASSGTPAVADDGERAWSVRPATDKGEPDHRTHFTLQGGPGDTVTDYILISNASKVAATFDVYATDAFNTSAGAFDLLPAAKNPVDLGAWITFPTQQVKLDAGASVAMAFKIAVPANAAPGDHAGGVVVALSTGTDVRLDTRVATRVYLRVPGFLRPVLSVQYVQPTYAGVTNPFGGGKLSVAYTVANTGNIRLQSHPTVTVKSAIFGTKLGEVKPADLAELLPGQHVEYHATIDGVFPAGPLTVTVDLKPFADPEQPVGQTIGDFSGSATVWAVPWLLLLLIVVLLGFGFAAVWTIRRRRRGDGARPDRTPPSSTKAPASVAVEPVPVGAAAGTVGDTPAASA
jgi:Bacterial protein of unknown function (DUF916)